MLLPGIPSPHSLTPPLAFSSCSTFYLCSSILSRLQGMDGEAASAATKDARLASFEQYRTEWDAEMRSMEVANQSAADAEAGRMVSCASNDERYRRRCHVVVQCPSVPNLVSYQTLFRIKLYVSYRTLFRIKLCFNSLFVVAPTWRSNSSPSNLLLSPHRSHAKSCANWKRPCPKTRWSVRTLAIPAPSATATCVSKLLGPTWPP